MVRTGRFCTKGREEEEKNLYAHLCAQTILGRPRRELGEVLGG